LTAALGMHSNTHPVDLPSPWHSMTCCPRTLTPLQHHKHTRQSPRSSSAEPPPPMWTCSELTPRKTQGLGSSPAMHCILRSDAAHKASPEVLPPQTWSQPEQDSSLPTAKATFLPGTGSLWHLCRPKPLHAWSRQIRATLLLDLKGFPKSTGQA